MRPPGRAQLSAPPITPEAVTRAELANGLVALVKEQPGSGQVTVHGYVRAGSMYDGPRSGLARFTTAMLQRGTATMTAPQLAEALDRMGASLVLRVDLEVIWFQLRALVEDFAPALTILAEVLTAPVFPPAEVERTRGELLTAVRWALQDTRHVAERAFRRQVYPEAHPQVRVPDGDEEVIAQIDRDELAAYHRERVRSEATILAVVGDLASPRVLDELDRRFAPWPRGGVWTLPGASPIPPPAGPVRAEVRLAGKIQSDLVLGAPGLPRRDPGYYEAMVANLILGQLGLMGRLGERVREEQGMAYYAFSELRAGLLAGPWWVRAGVNPRNEQRAVETIQRELARFAVEGPQPEELADARDFLIGSMAVRLETMAGVAQTLADIELYDLGLDYLERYPGIIRGLTADAITAAARRFAAGAQYLAIAGPPAPADS